MHDILEPRHHMIDYVEFASADPQAMCVFLRLRLAEVFNGSVPTMSPFTALGWRVASIAPTWRAGLQTAAP